MEQTLNVAGMTCDGCERSVVKALQLLAGVQGATADHRSGRVTVTLDAEVGHDVLVGAIEDAGYDVLPADKKHLPMA